MAITTQQSRIPWSWALALALPAGVAMLVEMCSGMGLTFTMKKFVADPAMLVLLGSINVAFNFLVAPWAAWRSDHGRRGATGKRRVRYFALGWTVMALALIATPWAPNLAVLALCVVVWQFGMDWGYTGPWDPLYYEIVPRPQRGRAVALRRGAMITARVVFNLVLLGQFDQPCPMHAAMPASTAGGAGGHGAQMVYLLAGMLALVCVVGAAWLIREQPAEPSVTATPSPPSVRRHWAPVAFVRQVLGPRQWRPFYWLALCPVILTTSLGTLQPLLIAEQFGYPMRVYGRLETIAMIPEVLLLLPLVSYLADRWSRWTLLRVGMVIGTVYPLVYWAFVRYLAVDQIPTPTQIVVFSVLGHVSRMIACVTFEPLLFDLAPRQCLGTVQAGVLMVRGVCTVVLMNGVGWWVKGWSALFNAPGQYDYMSGYLYLAALGVLGCGVVWYVSRRYHAVFATPATITPTTPTTLPPPSCAAGTSCPAG